MTIGYLDIDRTRELVRPNVGGPLTSEQVRRALDLISTPDPRPYVPLPFDPDDYPVV